MLKKQASTFSQALSKVHGSIYSKLNENSTRFLQKNSTNIPLWLTADVVTSGRLALVFPTTILISKGYTVLPATLVLVNAAFDYVDGAVARWEKEDKARSLAMRMQRARFADVGVQWNNQKTALDKNWGAYYDALADKAFAIPVWCAICVMNPDMLWLQVGALSHVAIESFSAYTRTKSYFSSPKAASVVTANSTGKVKQMVSMLGTALALIPPTQVLGGVLLWGSLPLSVASLADKVQQPEPARALVCSTNLFDPNLLTAMSKSKQSYEVIACIPSKSTTKEAVLNCSDSFDGAVVLQDQLLDMSEFDRLEATVVYVGSDADLQLIDPKLAERGVVRKL